MGGKITLAILRRFGYNSKVSSAGVMELVDVVDSKSTSPLHTALAETLDFARLFQN